MVHFFSVGLGSGCFLLIFFCIGFVSFDLVFAGRVMVEFCLFFGCVAFACFCFLSVVEGSGGVCCSFVVVFFWLIFFELVVVG